MVACVLALAVVTASWTVPAASPSMLDNPLSRKFELAHIDVQLAVRHLQCVNLGLPFAQGAFGHVLDATIEGAEVKHCVAKRAAKGKADAETYLASEAHLNEYFHKVAPGSRHLAPFLGVANVGWTDHLIWERCPGAQHSLDWYLELPERQGHLARDLGVVATPDVSVLTTRLQTVLGRKLLHEMLSALALLHTHGVIHRDVKPENWLVDVRTQSLRLIDFGAAYAFRDGWTEQQVPGTEAYAPPEQTADPTAPWSYDLYSTAMVWLRCCVTSYSSAAGFEALRASLESQADPGDWLAQRHVGPADTAGPEMWELIGRMLARDPRKRATVCEHLGSFEDMNNAASAEPLAAELTTPNKANLESCLADFSCPLVLEECSMPL